MLVPTEVLGLAGVLGPAEVHASANGGAGAGRGASASKSSRTLSSVIHALP